MVLLYHQIHFCAGLQEPGAVVATKRSGPENEDLHGALLLPSVARPSAVYDLLALTHQWQYSRHQWQNHVPPALRVVHDCLRINQVLPPGSSIRYITLDVL